MSNNPSSLDVKTSSEDSLQLKSDMGSSFPELAMKVRKAYTITKQRERWTEEEHNRFLEALKLYGRAWRQIEEHIGTKTAVQIRSHAQKFFTKVSRESAGESSGEVKSIEIPPPRPKRKPMHPYPRKLGNSPGISVTEKPEWPLVPKFSVPGQDSIQIPKQSSPEQDNMSPTSVLSAVGSDAFGSSASEIVNNSSTSPASSGDGSDPIGTSGSGQDYVCQSAMTSVEEEDKSVMPHKFDMELDVFTDDSISCKEASPTQTLTSSLKLFGKTVTVADSQKSLSSTTKNHSEQNANDEALPSGEGTSNWKSWPNGVTPMFYFLPSHGNLSSSSAVSMFPMPWVFYQDAPSTMTNPQSVSSEQEQLPYCREEVADIGEVHNGWRPSKTSAFRSLKATTKKPAKGFVPYKRCVGDKKVDNQMMVNDNGDGQGVQLCL